METFALIGDIGGTNCRLRLISLKTSATEDIIDSLVVNSRYQSSKYPSLYPVIQQFLIDNGLTPASPMYPQVCAFCVAGPCDKISRTNQFGIVEEGTVANSTALQWEMSSLAIADLLQIPPRCVRIMNDFEGIGYGVLALQPEHQHTLTDDSKVKPLHGAPIAVIGPGTGLGMGYLTFQQQTQEYVVNSSEGGHTTFAPMSSIEFDLMCYIQQEFNTTHVSFERICCGSGIRSVYRFLKHQENPQDPLYIPTNSKIYKAEHKPLPSVDPVLGADHPAQIIFESAQAGDKICGRAVNIFLRALGNAAGNLGITTLPYGGLFIAGGMTPKIQWAFEPRDGVTHDPNEAKLNTHTFMESFLNKGRLAPYLEKVPVHLVLIDEVGLMGCTVIAKRIAFRLLESKL